MTSTFHPGAVCEEGFRCSSPNARPVKLAADGVTKEEVSGAPRSGNSDWYLVVRGGDGVLRIVARNGSAVNWRPLSNVFRGPRLRVAQRLVDAAMSTAEPVSGAGFAAPVHLCGVEPTVALLSLCDPNPPRIPTILLWRWEFRRGQLPPVLHMSSSAAAVWGVSERTGNCGPADFYSGVANLQEVLPHLRFLYEAPPSSMRRSTITLADRRGSHGTIEAYEIVQQVSGGRVVTGLGWSPEEEAGCDVLSPRSVDAAAWEVLVRADSERLVVAADMRFPHYPYVVKWISLPPEEMAMGLSQGVDQPVLHPDSIDRLSRYAATEAHRSPRNCPPLLHGIRVRSEHDDWIRGSGRGFQIGANVYPSLWLWVLSVAS